MDAAAAVVGERVAVKLRGYFELAKEEIDKAVRAEEWGLPDEAAAHYRNAQRVMLEAKAARVPDAVSSSERGQVRVYQEKIAKWQAQVEERLRVLGQRSGEGAAAAVEPNKLVLTRQSKHLWKWLFCPLNEGICSPAFRDQLEGCFSLDHLGMEKQCLPKLLHQNQKQHFLMFQLLH